MRGRIVAHFLVTGARYTVADLTELLGLSRSPTSREVRRLASVGFLRRCHSPKRSEIHYEIDETQPGLAELRRFAQIAMGEAAMIREAISNCSPQSLAWIYGPYAEGNDIARAIYLVVLTPDRTAVSSALRDVSTRMPLFRIASEVVSLKEWTYRLECREYRALRLRRTQRMWLLGNDDALRREERNVIESRAALKKLIANWREELSDDWDDDFDPEALIRRF